LGLMGLMVARMVVWGFWGGGGGGGGGWDGVWDGVVVVVVAG